MPGVRLFLPRFFLLLSFSRVAAFFGGFAGRVARAPRGFERQVLTLRSLDGAFAVRLDASAISGIELEDFERTGRAEIRLVDSQGRRRSGGLFSFFFWGGGEQPASQPTKQPTN